MRRNNIKLLNRKKAISEKSLIIGVDIGSSYHSVVFQNKEGLILESIATLYNSRKGFDYLQKKIQSQINTGLYSDVHIGFEPTGHYWKTIIHFLIDQGYKVHTIRTTAVKSQRELDESSGSKTDIRDANCIASLIREGKYIDSKVQKGVYQDLRDIGKLRSKTMQLKTSMLSRLRMLLEMYFPELIDCFWSLNSKGLHQLLKSYPFAQDILKISDDELKSVLKVKGINEARLTAMVNEIKQAAQKSIGISVTKTSRFNVLKALEVLELLTIQLKSIEIEMKELLNATEYWDYMKSINGVGIVSAATVLGELGDPGHFTTAKELIKFAGLDPKENSSGKYKGKVKISKKGRYLLRTMIYFISMRLIYREEMFKEYYHKRLSTRNKYGRSLEKKEALMAVGIKFLKVLFALFRDKTTYADSVKVEKGAA